MSHKKTHIYFIPGMAAGVNIFDNSSFPNDAYSVHFLDWLIPEKNESISRYAKRMASNVKHDDCVLIGVSFGGVIAQEMYEFLRIKKLIIISSVKTRYELPRRMKLARLFYLYKLIPTQLILSSDDLTKFSIGPRSKKRLTIYQEYLSVRNKEYLDWAIKNMVCWDRKTIIENIMHIHGDKDIIFPIKYIDQCEILKGGTHIMILNKGRLLSKKIMKAIDNYYESL